MVVCWRLTAVLTAVFSTFVTLCSVLKIICQFMWLHAGLFITHCSWYADSPPIALHLYHHLPHPTQTWCYMPSIRQPGNRQNMTTCLAAAPSNSCYCNSCSQHQERFHQIVQLSTFCTALRWRLSPTHAQQGKSFVVLFLSQQVGLLYPELPSSRQLLPAIKWGEWFIMKRI